MAKEWTGVIGTVTGVLALIVSVTTAYFNLFRQTDELRVSVQNLPYVWTEKDTGQLAVTARQNITLINSGTRAVAVTKVELWVFQVDSVADGKTCAGDVGRILDYNFTPVVVKANDIVAQNIELINGNYETPLGQRVILDKPQKYLLMACMTFDVSTPDDSVSEIKKLLFVEEIGNAKNASDRISGDKFGDAKLRIGLDQPEVLIRKSRTFWGDN